MNDSLVDVRGLTIAGPDGREIVRNVSFSIGRAELVGIVGDSGGGKTSTALALLGYTRRGLRITAGSIKVDETELAGASERDLRRLRGRTIAYVPQDVRAAMTPHRRLRELLDEAMAEIEPSQRSERRASVLSLVELGGLETLLTRYPHEVSGGQLQRFALALAIAGGASIIVMDEPTSSLDHETRDRLLDHISEIRNRLGTSFVVITHDLHGVATRLDRLLLMSEGTLRPVSPPDTRPMSIGDPNGPAPATDGILTIKNLVAWYGPSKRDLGRAVLTGASISIPAASCVAMVGPSGCGKSTLARCVAGLHRDWEGEISLDGKPLARDARDRPARERQRVQLVFQNPYSSLNPRRTVADLISRPMILQGRRQTAPAETEELLRRMRLPADFARRYPRELSGGERQRVAIARALGSNPDVLICDEITSALDSTTQGSILDLLESLQHEYQFAILLITHDHAVASRLANRIVTIRDGLVTDV